MQPNAQEWGWGLFINSLAAVCQRQQLKCPYTIATFACAKNDNGIQSQWPRWELSFQVTVIKLLVGGLHLACPHYHFIVFPWPTAPWHSLHFKAFHWRGSLTFIFICPCCTAVVSAILGIQALCEMVRGRCVFKSWPNELGIVRK